jgi:hypothetical protein
MWTISLSILSQTVFHIFPGKHPQSFYLCLGTFPLAFKEQKVKVNWPSFALALTSLAVHLSIGLRTQYFRRKSNQVEAIARGLTQVEDQRQKVISGQKLVSLTTSSLAIVAMHVLAIIPIYVNKLEPAVVDEYPNYIWVYVHSLCVYPSFFIVMVVLFVTKNQQLRSSLYRNVSSEISRWAKFRI